MKTLFNTALPALALLALGGCATTGAVTSTEDDGVYYSSKDRTTAVQAPATRYQSGGYSSNSGYGSASTTTQAPAGENANPDYQGGTTQQGTASSTDYYDDNYSYNSVQPSGFGQPYTGPGVSSYNYTPNWSVAPTAYASPWGYGTGLSMAYGYGGYSPFGYGFGYPAYAGFYDPFYSPFYSPWGYGYGSRFSIGFGYGWGGGWGNPYGGWGYPGYAYGGYPYGYGYGRGYYGDYYGGGYGGYGRPVIYSNGSRSGSGSNPILVGPRTGRGGAVMGNANAVGGGITPGSTTVVPGRRGNVMAPSTPMSGAVANPAYNAAQPASAPQPQLYGRGAGRNATFGGGEVVGQPAYSGATGNVQPAASAAPADAAPTGRRGGFFREMFANPNNANAANGNMNNDQRMQRRTYSQPSYEQRAMNQPAYQQPQRSFERPTFSQPQQAPQRSFGGGGGNFGGGGGSFGGGGGGGGRRR